MSAKIEKLKIAGEDVNFRKKFTNGKTLDVNEIARWTGEVNYVLIGKELERLADKFGFNTEREKGTLVNYLVMGVVMFTRQLEAWTGKHKLQESEKPNLIALKWDMFFRDKQIVERRRQGKSHKEIGDEFNLNSGEQDSWQIVHRYRKRLHD